MDVFGSHQALLVAAMAGTSGDILEMGGGWYSTPLVSAFANMQGRNAFTIETGDFVYNILRHLETERHRIMRIQGYKFDKIGKFVAEHGLYVPHYIDLQSNFLGKFWSMYTSSGKSNFSVVFVDQAPGFLRAPALRFFSDKADFLITHDTEHVKHYGLEPLLSDFRYRWDFELHSPKSAIVSNTHDCSGFRFLGERRSVEVKKQVEHA